MTMIDNEQSIDIVVVSWESDGVRDRAKVQWEAQPREGVPFPESLFVSMDTLRYVLRSIEQNLSFIRRVVLICPQAPDWLARAHPKLKVVLHQDIFPDSYVQSKYNRGAIATCLHRIPDLANCFLYSDDCSFVLKCLPANRFFLDAIPVQHIDLDVSLLRGFTRSIHRHFVNKRLDMQYMDRKRRWVKQHWRSIFRFRNGILKNLRHLTIIWLRYLPFHFFQPVVALTRHGVQLSEERFPAEFEYTRGSDFFKVDNVSSLFIQSVMVLENDFVGADAPSVTRLSASDLPTAMHLLAAPERISSEFLTVSLERIDDLETIRTLRQALHGYLQARFPEASSFELESSLPSPEGRCTR